MSTTVRLGGRSMSEYRVKFEVYEGPLDLLLYLIKKEEVDIYEVNLTRIATEFIEYLNLMRELDLDVAGEFVVMAATLMLIKSRELLPRDQRPDGQSLPEDELDDPRWELIRQLVEYKKFKDAAVRLQDLEVRAENTFPRVPGRIELPEEQAPRRSEATIFDLLSAVNAILKRFAERAGATREVVEDRWSVSEKIETILVVIQTRGAARFSELFQASAHRAEIVATFLALLELVRLRRIRAIQPEPFAEIELHPASPEETAPETAQAETNAPEQAEVSSAPGAEHDTNPAPGTPDEPSSNPAQWN